MFQKNPHTRIQRWVKVRIPANIFVIIGTIDTKFSIHGFWHVLSQIFWLQSNFKKVFSIFLNNTRIFLLVRFSKLQLNLFLFYYKEALIEKREPIKKIEKDIWSAICNVITKCNINREYNSCILNLL